MTNQLDHDINAKINEILGRAQLSTEILQMIHSSLDAKSSNEEPFKWAHLTIMSCECAGGDSEVALSGAIAMELAGLAADIFDDIQDQDNDDLPWRQISPACALNLAICLSMLSHKAASMILDKKRFREVSQVLDDMWIAASDGQLQEVLLDTCGQVALEQYFELVKRKSGSLTAAACKIGATLGGASESVVLQFGQFGTNLGIMSQIRNDLIDFLDFEDKSDFINNRKTLPYVYLLNILQGEKAVRFKELTQIKSKGISRFGKEEKDKLKQLTIDEGAAHYGRVMYELFRQTSLEIMQAIPLPEKRKEKMIQLVDERH